MRGRRRRLHLHCKASKQVSQSNGNWQGDRLMEHMHTQRSYSIVFQSHCMDMDPFFSIRDHTLAEQRISKSIRMQTGDGPGGTKVARAAFLDVLPAGSTSMPCSPDHAVALSTDRPTRETFRCVQQQQHPPMPITDVGGGVWISSGCRRRMRHACRRRPGPAPEHSR